MNLNENMQFEGTLVSDYKDNHIYRNRFNGLTSLVFGFSLEDWYQKGYWDDRYICYSFMKDDEIIANVSVSKMDLLINGVNKKAIQIGTVITHPDHRGKGLSSALMRHVMDLYENDCDLFFLFANRSAIDFYPKFGFESYQESQFTLNYDLSLDDQSSLIERNSLRKLNISEKEDADFIKQMVMMRKPVSNQFGVSNNNGLFMFHALHVHPESLYYSQVDDAIVVFQQEGTTLHVYDVVSQHNISGYRLLSHIANEQIETIHFYFTPDQFTDKPQYIPLFNHDDMLFIKANFEVNKDSKFCIPVMAHA